MRYALKILVVLTVFIFLLSVSCYASAGTEGEPSREKDSFLSELSKLITDTRKEIRKETSSAISPAVKCFAVVLLCTAAGLINEKTERTASFAGLSAILLIMLNDYSSVLNSGADVIEKMTVMSKSILPAMASSAITSGNFNSAAYVGTIFASDVICTIIRNCMLPLVYTYLAISVSAAFCNNPGLSRAGNLLYAGISGALKIILSLFAAVLMSGRLIGKAGGAIAIKTVKLISGAVPVVGSVIGDAAEAVISGASYIGAAAGAAGIVGVAGICLTPVVMIGIKSLSFAVVSVFTEMCGGKQLVALTGDISKAFRLILAFVASCSAMLMCGIYMLAAGMLA